MLKVVASDRQCGLPVLLGIILLLSITCGTTLFAAQSQPAHSAAVPASKATQQAPNLGLPLTFERHTGDLDAMVKVKSIRALVLYSHSSFFYVNGKPEGIYYEALRDFEQFVNQKLHTGKQHVQVTFIPVRPDQLESYLIEGVGDLIAYPVAVTPEREQKVAFSLPLETGVKQISRYREKLRSGYLIAGPEREEDLREFHHHVLRQSGKD